MYWQCNRRCDNRPGGRCALLRLVLELDQLGAHVADVICDPVAAGYIPFPGVKQVQRKEPQLLIDLDVVGGMFQRVLCGVVNAVKHLRADGPAVTRTPLPGVSHAGGCVAQEAQGGGALDTPPAQAKRQEQRRNHTRS